MLSLANMTDCIVIGDVLFDMLIEYNPSQLSLSVGGVTYSPIKFEFGGSGNVAVGISKLGGKVNFIGKAGNDNLGRYYKKNLVEEGIETNILFDNFHSTGITVIFIDEKGERTFLTSRGANDFLNIEEEIPTFEMDLHRANFCYFSGFSLINNPQKKSIIEAAQIAKDIGVKIIFDPGAFNIINQNRPAFEKLFNLCDVFIPNFAEASSLTHLDHIDEIIDSLSKTIPLTILKMGDRGCFVINSKGGELSKVKRTKCKDSSGAGDAFASAFIFGLSRGFPIKKIARLANWYASYIVKKVGARSFPDQNKINTFIKKNNIYDFRRQPE